MPDMIRVKIDLNKIDESALFAGKNGASYLDLTLIPSKNSQYGDSHFCVQDLGKAAREAGKKGPIIGNAKTLAGKGAAPTPRTAPVPQSFDEGPVPF